MKELTQREKILLQVLIGIAALVAAYYLIILPLLSFAGDTESEMQANIKNIEKLEKIYNQYRDIQQKKSRYVSMLSKKNENTTSLVEQWATSTGIAKNIAYTRRNQTNIQNKYVRITTDIKIEGIAIQSFLKFLYEIESSDTLMRVNYLRIQQALKGTKMYDINLKIDSYTMQ